MTRDSWNIYDRWNRAICNYYFDPVSAHTPVYLDIDDTALDEIGRLGGFGEDDGPMVDQFIHALRLSFSGQGDFLSEHVVRARRWGRRKRDDDTGETIPPFVALLGFFSFVAYQMRNDGFLSGNNYHDRLERAVYGGSGSQIQKDRLGRSFRKHTIGFWGSLALWLEGDKLGSLGLPTADSGPFRSRRFIGYPISQAIMRREDRAKLPQIFRAGRLRPGDIISLEGMVNLLSQHLHDSSLSQVVKSTFEKGDDDKIAVAQIAISVLRTWQAASPNPNSTGNRPGINSQDLKLLLSIEFAPRPQAWFSVGFRAIEGPREQSFKVTDSTRPVYENSSGAELDHLSFEEADPGIWQNRENLSISDLLITEMLLESEDKSRELDWSPTGLTILEFDDNSRRFVSTTSATSDKRLALLVRDRDVENVIANIDKSLVEGTSYRERNNSTMRGIPEGWVLFDGVHLGSDVLGVVQASPRVNLEGGVKIPGQRNWLAARPPKAAFVSSAPVSEIDLRIVENKPFEKVVPRQLAVSGGSRPDKLAELNEADLAIGSYKLGLKIGIGSRAMESTMTFGICSADVPRPDTRRLQIDQDLLENPLYESQRDESYEGDQLKEYQGPPASQLPPLAFQMRESDEEVLSEPAEPRLWGPKEVRPPQTSPAVNKPNEAFKRPALIKIPSKVDDDNIRLGSQVVHVNYGQGEVISFDNGDPVVRFIKATHCVRDGILRVL